MAYCTYCGTQLLDGARYCIACGAPVTQETAAASAVPEIINTVTPQIVNTVTPVTSATIYTGEGYAVMLVSTGTCTLSAAADLVSDTCGYTDADALTLVANAPTLIAQSLNKSQAVYLAQSLTEYGMEAAIYDRNGNQTFTSDVSSVFDTNGSLLTKVAGALGLIGVGNRIAGAIRRLTLPSRPRLYTMDRPVRKPPVRRHTINRQAPPPHRQPEPPRQVVHVSRQPQPHDQPGAPRQSVRQVVRQQPHDPPAAPKGQQRSVRQEVTRQVPQQKQGRQQPDRGHPGEGGPGPGPRRG